MCPGCVPREMCNNKILVRKKYMVRGKCNTFKENYNPVYSQSREYSSIKCEDCEKELEISYGTEVYFNNYLTRVRNEYNSKNLPDITVRC